jgi:opacity protein-like surface antigen
MKKFLIVIVTIVFLVGAAATAARAKRVPSTRDGDPDEVQSVKRLDEPTMGSGLSGSQGRLTQRRLHKTGGGRAKRLHIEVRFPGRRFFLEK